MYRKEEDEPSDHKNGHWLSKGGATVGATLGFFGSHILFGLGYDITDKLIAYATTGIGAGIGGFIGYVLDNIWVHRHH